MVLGANTFREFVQMLGTGAAGSDDLDPVNTRMRNMPTTVISTTLEGSFEWPDATLVSGDAVDVVARTPRSSSTDRRCTSAASDHDLGVEPSAARHGCRSPGPRRRTGAARPVEETLACPGSSLP